MLDGYTCCFAKAYSTSRHTPSRPIEACRAGVPRKDIGPFLWDLSLAEHLKPGEEYQEVSMRF